MIVMTNSFRGGTGKSTIISNLSSYLASFGRKVLIIDADTISPGVHAIFGLSKNDFSTTLTDFLKGKAKPQDAVYDISSNLKLPDDSLLLVPSSIESGDIAELLQAKLSGDKILGAIKSIQKTHNVDYVLIDTHPGINEEMLVVLDAVDMLVNVVRPDNQDYQGLEVMAGITGRMQTNAYVVLNKVPAKLRKGLETKVHKKFGIPVAGMLPFSEDLMSAQSQYVFSDKFPGHEFSTALQTIGYRLFGVKPRQHLEMMQHILGVIKRLEPVSMKKLEQERGVYIPKARRYLDEMLQRGFVTVNAGNYSVSRKGEQFLAKFRTIKRFVRDFRL